MVYRFFVAIIFTFTVFPFAAMYSFAAVYPDAHFALDRQTWMQGMVPIAFGWVVFLLPGMLPFVGHRYYGWVAKKTGFDEFIKACDRALGRLGDRLKWLKLKTQTAASNRSSGPGLKKRFQGGLQSLRDRRKKVDDEAPLDAEPQAQVEHTDQVSQEPQPAPDKARKRLSTGDSIQKARQVFKDAPKHIATVKSRLEDLRHHLTPDDLQRTIDLNQYTLETFSHLKRVLSELLGSVELSADNRAFCKSVVAALPEPPSPSASDRPPPNHSFSYPAELREPLKEHAARSRLAVRDTDFAAAEGGDLERALLLVHAIVAHESRERAVVADPETDDLLLLHSPA
jgi:hypothetical protein